MSVKKLSALFLVTLMISATTIGCDNRSQLEKDADKAMGNAEKAVGQMEKDAGKALDKIGN